ncbi:MAG: hypothetical protein RSB93_04370 [Rikenellaceae bacterium]
MKIYQGETLDIVLNLKDDDDKVAKLSAGQKLSAVVSNKGGVVCTARSDGSDQEEDMAYHICLTSPMTKNMNGDYMLQVALSQGDNDVVIIGDPVTITVEKSKIVEVL